MGKVKFEEVEHGVGGASALPKDPNAVRKAIMDKANAKGVVPPVPDPNDTIQIAVTFHQLYMDGIVTTLLQATYDAIDNMPPFKTLKETKKAIKLQEDIEKLLKQKEK